MGAIAARTLATASAVGIATASACTPDLSRTTRPTIADLRGATESIAQSMSRGLEADDVRTLDGSPPVLTVGRVENRSADVFTRAEQHFLMQSVARRLADTPLARSSGLLFTMQPEAIEQIRRRGEVWEGYAANRQPTHAINGVFATITRVDNPGDPRSRRRDLFVFDYTITRLADGAVVAADAVAFEKTATGRLFN